MAAQFHSLTLKGKVEWLQNTIRDMKPLVVPPRPWEVSPMIETSTPIVVPTVATPLPQQGLCESQRPHAEQIQAIRQEFFPQHCQVYISAVEEESDNIMEELRLMAKDVCLGIKEMSCQLEHLQKETYLRAFETEGPKTEKSLSTLSQSSQLCFPFPLTLRREKSKFDQVLDNLREVKVNEPLVDSILQMQCISKLSMDILLNKQPWEEVHTICLTKVCSVVTLHDPSRQCKDPGLLSISCTIGETNFDHVILNSEAEVNFLPYTWFKKLGFDELKPTLMRLQFEDKSFKHPRGVIENVLVKVDKYHFPIDFVTCEMADAIEAPLILGRPFLATGKATLDKVNGKLVLNMGSKRVCLNAFREKYRLQANMKHSKLDAFNLLSGEEFQEHSSDDPRKMSHKEFKKKGIVGCLLDIGQPLPTTGIGTKLCQETDRRVEKSSIPFYDPH